MNIITIDIYIVLFYYVYYYCFGLKMGYAHFYSGYLYSGYY